MSYTDDDQGGTTAQFQAFAHRDDGGQSQDWETRGSGSRTWLVVGILAAVVAVVAIVASLV